MAIDRGSIRQVCSPVFSADKAKQTDRECNSTKLDLCIPPHQFLLKRDRQKIEELYGIENHRASRIQHCDGFARFEVEGKSLAGPVQ